MNAKSDLVGPLSDIAPKWAKRLEEEKNLPFPLSTRWFRWYFELDIPKRCIVGEANGSSSSYEKECKECNSIGGHSFLVRSRSGFEKDVNTFLQHWSEKHLT
jgi:hypothetical protein